MRIYCEKTEVWAALNERVVGRYASNNGPDLRSVFFISSDGPRFGSHLEGYVWRQHMRIVIRFGHWQHRYSRVNEVFSVAAGSHVAGARRHWVSWPKKNEDNTSNFVWRDPQNVHITLHVVISYVRICMRSENIQACQLTCLEDPEWNLF
jgi:hypothetical protein